MLELNNVSLIAADCVNVPQTVRAMQHSLKRVRFRNAVLFTNQQTSTPPIITRVPIAKLASREAYSRFMLMELHCYREMLGDYILVVQHDGFIVNADAWEACFLDYDYIGAPWTDAGVGNGGFSLRSRRLLDVIEEIKGNLKQTHPEDEVIGRLYRMLLEEKGIRFAPLETARRFSVEDKEYAGSFGYHGRKTEKLSGISVVDADFDIESLYRRARHVPSDINEHAETLHQLSRECRHITEFGTGAGKSTSAFLCARPDRLRTYDTRTPGNLSLLQAAARIAGLDFEFVQHDCLQAEIEPTDLLFIDTYHTYEQTQAELRRHADKVRTYIVLHDTTTFGALGEGEGHVGIWPAVQEFLEAHSEWSLAERFEHNNGLAILRRTQESSFALSKSIPVHKPSPLRRSLTQWWTEAGGTDSQWLILGKGPSFQRRGEFDLSAFRTIAINHAVREISVDVASAIDLDVIASCGPDIYRNAHFLLMPRRPHVNNAPTARRLEDFFDEHPVLDTMNREGRLVWYNLLGPPEAGAPVIPVGNFSAAVLVNLLGTLGGRVIRTLGVDGGSAYASIFASLNATTRLNNGCASYDVQFATIAAAIERYGIDFAPLTCGCGLIRRVIEDGLRREIERLRAAEGALRIKVDVLAAVT